MAAPEVTYYGPVPTQGSTSTTNNAQSVGSLAKYVQQSVSDAIQFTEDTLTYIEEFKGATSNINGIANTMYTIPGTFAVGTATYNTIFTQLLASGNTVRRFFPSLAMIADAVLQDVQVRQLESGNHSILRLTFVKDVNTASTEDPTVDGSKTIWNVTWQSYSFSPYGFCANDTPEAKYAGTQGAGEEDTTTTAYKQHIIDCIQQPADSGQKLKQYYNYMSTTLGGQVFTLNKMERLIMDKVLQDKSAIYHYPIVTKTTVYTPQITTGTTNIPSCPFTNIGENIDILTTSLPNGCPYSFNADQWKEWLKVGDNATVEREVLDKQAQKIKNTFTRTETWWGATDWDDNFYGSYGISWTSRNNNIENGRWTKGKQ